jgi:CubicO group peptidase (beta-lactamase class C family)
VTRPLQAFALTVAACASPQHVAATTSVDAPPTPADAAAADFSGMLVPIASHAGLPALAAAVSDDHQILARGVTGIRKVGNPTLATFDDRWHLGSDTKAMTATLAALEVEAGKLRWDMTLPQAFPSWQIDPGYAQVTLRMLLAHVGGAPGDFPDDVWAVMRGSGTPQALRTQAVQMMLSRPPGATVGTYTYANAGYMMAGVAIEVATGRAWEDEITARVFQPLGMASCGFGPSATGTQVDQPWGHILQDGTLVPVNLDNPAAIGPAGTVHCSLADWLVFLRDHLAGARGEPTHLAITADDWTLLHTAWTGSNYALGWAIVQRPWATGNVFTHTGSNTFDTAEVWIAPSVNRIYISATNRGDNTAYAGADAAITAAFQAYPGS